MEAVAEPAVLEQLRHMFGCEPLFRSTSLFFNPRETSMEGSWHRDSQFLIPNEEEERQALHDMKMSGLLHARGCQMQVALVPSDDVELVEGSHLRWDSPDEYAVRRADGGAHSTELMPNSTRVALQPGDAVCFNSWGYHRGRYHTDKERRTLMFTYTGEPFSTFDYFSDQPWILEEGYLDGLSAGCQAFFRRYIRAFGDRKLQIQILISFQAAAATLCPVLTHRLACGCSHTGIRAKQAGTLEGSGEGRHPAYPNHLEQFYSQAASFENVKMELPAKL
jgi:hypothetical protein